ncbi:MAG: hypothetical protein M1497_13610 [Nitrospirae bacterium]|nr:hypothetical protein [Nitrospirota bacterium]
MKTKQHKISCEVSKDGKITIYPSLYGTKEIGRLRRALRWCGRLLRLRKRR